MNIDDIKHGSRVTILVYSGMGRDGKEFKPQTGTAVMRGPHGWVLNMGGRYGTPGIADDQNILAIRKEKR